MDSYIEKSPIQASSAGTIIVIQRMQEMIF